MGLFVCAKCKCVENSALGHYHSRHRPEDFKWEEINEQYKGQPLCSECMPLKFVDGIGNYGNGKWHNKFSKRHIDDFLKSESAKHYYLTKNCDLIEKE